MLYLVVCAAGPASEVATLVAEARATGWDVRLFATPSAVKFLDLPTLESQTGHPVRSADRDPDQPRASTPRADAIIVAPATYNTINKLATGIADS
ncbi:MAG: flavoprotein [Natronosporangium sp.]